MKNMNIPMLVINSFFLVLATGCGNLIYQGEPQAPAGSGNLQLITPVKNYQVQQEVTTTLADNKSYNCPSAFDIIPSPVTPDGSDYFKICSSSTDTNSVDILVQAKLTGAQSICIFPAEAESNDIATWIRNPATGLPFSECAEMVSNEAPISFGNEFSTQGPQFNAAYIVNENDEEQMQECLLQDEMSNCPTYSFGKFR